MSVITKYKERKTRRTFNCVGVVSKTIRTIGHFGTSSAGFSSTEVPLTVAYYNFNLLRFLALLLCEFAVFLFIAVVKSSPDVPQCFHVEFSDREHEAGKFNRGDWFGLVDGQDCDQLF